MLMVENRDAFCLLVSLYFPGCWATPGTKEECGTFEPLQQTILRPYRRLMAGDWGSLVQNSSSLLAQKSDRLCVACSDNASHRGEADEPGGPVFMRGVMAARFCVQNSPMMKLMKHSYDFNRRLQSSNLDLPLCLINSVRKLPPLLQTLWHGGVLTLLSIYRGV
jgi:hypothetical protein